MNVLVFDTETTGKCEFRLAADHPRQPRVIQIGALLCNQAGDDLDQMNVLIIPNGFEIPLAASAVHGITTEKAITDGIPIEKALQRFSDMARQSEVLVGHNSDFDTLLMKGEFLRAKMECLWKPVKCTMKAATPICKIPGPYGFKWPKLIEAYQFAFNQAFDGAHDAFADVKATARLFFWLKEKGAI